MREKTENGGEVNHGFENDDNSNTQRQNQLIGSSNFILIDNDNKESPKLTKWFCKKARNFCSKKTLLRRFPFVTWLREYSSNSAAGDVIAGITVGLTLIPQALAYSNIARVSPEYGLYSAFLGCFVYIIFGSSKDVAMGPTAISALLTAQTVKNKGLQHTVLLCFLTGFVQLLMGFFGLGFLINFISGPVSSGFTSAVALIVVASQIKNILGIDASGSTFIDTIKSVFNNIHQTSFWDTVLGLTSILILLSMRILTVVRIKPADKGIAPNKFLVYLNSTLWLVGVARNAILVVISSLIAYYVCQKGDPPFKITGSVPPGLPTLQLPNFTYHGIIDNTTITEDFFDMVADLGSGLIVVPLLGLLEDVAVCKAFSNGKTVDATQELIALGVSNLANSFAQGFPVSGALARSAVNNASGVKTPMGNLYTGVLVILALLFFTPYFYYIPEATLGAIVIAAAIFVVEVRVLRPMWKAKKSDLVPGLATFIACLALPLQYGILIGMGINVIFILYHAARPKITVEKITSSRGNDYLLLTPDRCLIFPSVDYVRSLVNKHSIRQKIPVVIDCSYIYGADYTAATVIENLIKDFQLRKQPLLFFNVKPSVSSVFDGLSPEEFVVYYNREEIDEMLKRWNVTRTTVNEV